MRGPFLAIPLALVAGCSAPPGVTAEWAAVSAEAAEATVALSPEARAAAERLLAAPRDGAGAPAPPDELSWRVGDRLVFGVSVAPQQGETRHWLLEIAVAELPPLGRTGSPSEMRLFQGELTQNDVTRTIRLASAMLALELRVYDESGALQGSETCEAPETFLRRGLRSACMAAGTALEELGRASAESGDESSGPARAALDALGDVVMPGLAAATALANVLLKAEELRPILLAVVRRPPLALLLGGPPDLTVAPDFFTATDAPPVTVGDGPPLPASHLPLALTAEDHPALAARLTVVEPGRLLRAGAGVVAIEARRPGTDHPRLSVRLVGARRGAGPALLDSSLIRVRTVQP